MTKSSQNRIDRKVVDQSAPDTEKVAVITFVTVMFINSTNAIKVPTDGIETAKKILSEIETVLRTNGIYYNVERGIMFKTTELSHAYLSMEQVRQ